MAPIKEWFGVYNIIFNWFEEKYGSQALEEYWRHIAENCYQDVIELFKRNGLEGIKQYMEETISLDDGEYVSSLEDSKVTFKVKKCPDYRFLSSSSNPFFKPVKSYCKHHAVINSFIAEKSGFDFHMEECDDSGGCKWVFKKQTTEGRA
ncbi:MAG: hypothetical protein FIA99_09955 [Ruminiclostridium sp.]|nr:hypothetical protein [Ruminiclostridium sp.]